MKRTLLLTLVNAVVLSGCASAPSRSAVDPQVRDQLIADVDAVKAAATRRDRFATEAALTALTHDIAAAQAQGRLDPAKARTILAASDRVAEDMRTVTPLAVPAPPQVTVVVPAPPPPGLDQATGGQSQNGYVGEQPKNDGQGQEKGEARGQEEKDD